MEGASAIFALCVLVVVMMVVVLAAGASAGSMPYFEPGARPEQILEAAGRSGYDPPVHFLTAVIATFCACLVLGWATGARNCCWFACGVLVVILMLAVSSGYAADSRDLVLRGSHLLVYAVLMFFAMIVGIYIAVRTVFSLLHRR